jgi:type I restriction enzyme M protein
MDYWAETMQDDAYLIAADGWKATPYRVLETKNKDGRARRWTRAGPATWCPSPARARYFAAEQAAWTGWVPSWKAPWPQTELEEEHSGDDAAFSGFDKINDKVKSRIKEIGRPGCAPTNWRC